VQQDEIAHDDSLRIVFTGLVRVRGVNVNCKAATLATRYSAEPKSVAGNDVVYLIGVYDLYFVDLQHVVAKCVVVVRQFKETTSGHRIVSDLLQHDCPEPDLFFTENLGEAGVPFHGHDMGFLAVCYRLSGSMIAALNNDAAD
jgi:hypothetical protein